jgi:hypothetical protein
MPIDIGGVKYGPPWFCPAPWEYLEEEKGIIDGMGCFVLSTKYWDDQRIEHILKAVNAYACTICDNDRQCKDCRNRGDYECV